MQETNETAVTMQQEAESVKAPTLTLDAEERKIDLSFMEPAFGKMNASNAESGTSSAGSVDESMLTEAEKKQVEEFVRKIDVTYHVHFNDLNIVSRESDICAEQIKTIDQCRLEQYLGNVGSAVMEQVDKALVLSLGIRNIDTICETTVEAEDVSEEPQESLTIFQHNRGVRISRTGFIRDYCSNYYGKSVE